MRLELLVSVMTKNVTVAGLCVMARAANCIYLAELVDLVRYVIDYVCRRRLLIHGTTTLFFVRFLRALNSFHPRTTCSIVGQ